MAEPSRLQSTGITKGQTQLSDFHFQEIGYLRWHNNGLYLTIFREFFKEERGICLLNSGGSGGPFFWGGRLGLFI